MIITGCISISHVKPEATVYIKGYDSGSTLYVLIDNRIQNEFLSKSSGGIKDAKISDFRKSLEDAFTYAFSPYFKNVTFVTTHVPGHTVLNLKIAMPRLFLYQVHFEQTKHADIPMHQVKFKMQYAAELRQPNRPQKEVNKEVDSEGSANTIFSMNNLLRDVIEVMCRDIAKQLF